MVSVLLIYSNKVKNAFSYLSIAFSVRIMYPPDQFRSGTGNGLANFEVLSYRIGFQWALHGSATLEFREHCWRRHNISITSIFIIFLSRTTLVSSSCRVTFLQIRFFYRASCTFWSAFHCFKSNSYVHNTYMVFTRSNPIDF